MWNIFCDWYLELAKPVLQGADGPAKDETRAMTAWVRDEILKLLHPFTPFVTEELWQVTAEGGPAREGLLALASWPKPAALDDPDAEAEIGWVIDLVTAIRSVRAEMNIVVTTELPLVLVDVSPATQARAGRWAEIDPPAGASLRDIRSRTARRRARCSSSCAARWRRCRSRA